jgi:hypothetical protein
LDGDLFDKLDVVARHVRSTGPNADPTLALRPFGGLQLVLCGDFFQASFDLLFCSRENVEI